MPLVYIHKQTRTSDNALFAIVAVTCRLFDGKPTTVVLDQKEISLPLLRCKIEI